MFYPPLIVPQEGRKARQNGTKTDTFSQEPDLRRNTLSRDETQFRHAIGCLRMRQFGHQPTLHFLGRLVSPSQPLSSRLVSGQPRQGHLVSSRPPRGGPRPGR